MDPFKNTLNIGKILSEKLIAVGFTSEKELQDAGAEKIFIKIKANDPNACIDMLYAIEGAIQGIRWHNLPDSRKKALKQFYNSLV